MRPESAATSLRGRTVVVTGASSGIGRATATRLGALGARVVLAARDENGLDTTREAVLAAGGDALVVPTDVAHAEHMRQLAGQAIRWSGDGVYAWINNAGVGTYGYIDQFSAEELHRVIDVNLLGEIYGSRVILPHLVERGEGVIVNVGSILSEIPFPAMAPYVATKYGVRGFTESLRMELKHRAPGVRVCLVEPASVDTPFYRHALSRFGAMPKPVPPVFGVERVAEEIARLVLEPRTKAVAPRIGSVFTFAHRLAPAPIQWLLGGRRGLRLIRSGRPGVPDNNLFAPSQTPGTRR